MLFCYPDEFDLIKMYDTKTGKPYFMIDFRFSRQYYPSASIRLTPEQLFKLSELAVDILLDELPERMS